MILACARKIPVDSLCMSSMIASGRLPGARFSKNLKVFLRSS